MTATHQNLSYGSNAANVLDIYMPATPIAKPMPLFIMIHGGGWHAGDKTEGPNYHYGLKLMAKGYAVANINYRLLTNVNVSKFPNPNETNAWPACMVDCQTALCYLRSVAAQYGFDQNKFISWGDSAGALMAVWLGMSNVPLAGVNTFGSAYRKVAAAIGHSMPADLTLAINYPSSLPEMPSQWEKTLINTTNVADYQAASPVWNVAADMSPTVISQGSQDQIVLPQEGAAMQAALNRAGVPNLYLPYTGGHVFAGLSIPQEMTLLDQATAWALAHV